MKPQPLDLACRGDPNGTDCAVLHKNLRNPYYIGDQPGGTQVSGWLGAWTPQQSVWSVEASSTADVVQGVDFARRHRLRLAIKGGAHSYQGGSNAPDSLLIRTRAMRDIALHDAFIPMGGVGPGVPAVSIGAGAIWADAYDEVTTRAGRYVQGGGCTTVGCAGLVLGGGFGSFSKCYGTAGASLIEAEIVTADGQIRVVNARRDPDLYWALKGAGQCAFGVVTRLTLRTHELGQSAGDFYLTINAASTEAFRNLLAAFVDVIATGLVSPHWGESVSLGGSGARLAVKMVFKDLTPAQAKAAWKPVTDLVAGSPADYAMRGPVALDQPMQSWWDFAATKKMGAPWARWDARSNAPDHHAWWAGDSDQVSMFIHGFESLWLPDSLLEEANRARLSAALFEACRHFGIVLHCVPAWKKDPVSGVIGAEEGPLIPMV